jgi:hypothetical protein
MVLESSRPKVSKEYSEFVMFFFLLILTEPTEGEVLSGLRARSSCASDTSSNVALVQVQRWLKTCIADHPQCGQGQAHVLPRRVIDTQSFIKGQPVRLRETNGERDRYICLSHSWGRPTIPPPLTTIANYTDRIAGIAWPVLPKTFQDTIDLARHLLIRYVWIDTFCIIQDDEKDWAEQAALMASIYSNAFLTIAAASATDCHAGLHSTSGSTQPFKKLEGCYSKDLYTHRLMPHVNEGQFRTGPACYPLLTRAWVYQERMLSPRILYFAGNEMNWECKQGRWCECGDMRYGLWDKGAVQTASLRLEQQLARSAHLQTPAATKRRRTSAWIFWAELVQGYALLDLSYTKDIFPALAGLAKSVQQMTNDVYLAGLWNSSLHLGLAWCWAQPAERLHRQKRPAKWRAPTWSWASIQGGGGVTWEGTLGIYRTPLIDILDVLCHPMGPDPLGALDEAWLRLSGSYVEMTLWYPGSNSYDRHALTEFSLHGCGETSTYTDLFIDYDVREEGQHHIANGSQVFILPLYEGNQSTVYLVLRRIDEDSQTYGRIGILMKKGGLPTEYVDENGETQRYWAKCTITIV